MNKSRSERVIFTPANEPYLGRDSVRAFDITICSCLEISCRTAPTTFTIEKTDLQRAACQLIPQAINIALSIRELVRQGYLFGALVLIRSLIERVAILRYLVKHADAIETWKRGWKHNEAPCLATMLDVMVQDGRSNSASDLTRMLNDIVHGKPDSAMWTLVPVAGENMGHAPSKILGNPTMCDEICLQAWAMLAVAQATIIELFPA